MQQAHFIDGHDIGLERGDGLAVEQFAGDAVFGQQGLLLLRRRDRIAAPRLQPAGLADAMPRFRLHDPFPVQFRRCADQSMQRGRPRPETRRSRIGQKARDPSGVLNRPERIPAQGGVAVGQVFRQRLPQRRIVERRYRAAADDAGIAIGGLAARLAPVDENDRHPALSRGIGRRYADDARAEHHDIRFFFRHRLSKHRHGNISHHGAPANGAFSALGIHHF